MLWEEVLDLGKLIFMPNFPIEPRLFFGCGIVDQKMCSTNEFTWEAWFSCF